MRHDEFDDARLWDMLRYAREIVETLAQRDYDDCLGDSNLRLATERRIEIIGEAARNVSDATKRTCASIPWQKIVSLRHILAHEYGEVKQEVIFRVATVHIPQLIALLEPVVPRPPEDKN